MLGLGPSGGDTVGVQVPPPVPHCPYAFAALRFTDTPTGGNLRFDCGGSASGVILLGTLASLAVVLAGGRVGPVPGVTPASRWFGLLRPDAVDPDARPLPGLFLVLAIAALLLVWLVVLWRRETWTPVRMRTAFLAWGLPLFVGPPLLSNDLGSYVAQGQLSLSGYSPYLAVPSELPYGPALQGVDPRWRGTFSPYGPLATWLQHAAARLADGNALASALLLRLLAIAGLVAIGLLAWRLAAPHRRTQAVLLTALNPLFLLHVGSAAHLDGLVCAFALAALYACRYGRTGVAVVLGCLAGAVKAPGFAVAAAVVCAAWWNVPPQRRLGRSFQLVVVAAGTVVATTFMVPHGLGWLAQLSTPTESITPVAPAAWLGYALYPFLVWTHVLTGTQALDAARLVLMLAGLAVVAVLLRGSDRRPVAATAGYVLVALTVFGPVLYPWYLLAGVSCLAVIASGHTARALIAASCVGSLMSVPGLSFPERFVLAPALAVGSVGVAVVLYRWRALPPSVRAWLDGATAARRPVRERVTV